MRLALIRHPVLRMTPGVCYGRQDFPIADDADIPEIVGRLGDFRAVEVRASPAGRCRALAEAIPSPHLTFDPRLLELDFGAWEGVAWDDIDRADLDRWAADPVRFAPPGGETGQSLIDRVEDCFSEVLARGADQAIVTHAGPLKVLTCLVRGTGVDLFTPSPAFASVAVFSLPVHDLVPVWLHD